MNQELYDKLKLAVEFHESELKIARAWNLAKQESENYETSFKARRTCALGKGEKISNLVLPALGIGAVVTLGCVIYPFTLDKINFGDLLSTYSTCLIPGPGFLLAGILGALYFQKRDKQILKEYETLWETEYLPQIEEKQKEVEDWEKRLKLLYEDCGEMMVGFLPEKYRNLQATHFMLNAVGDGRAETLKEAFNLYEEQLHRWRMEGAAQQAADVQAMAADEMRAQMAEANARLASIENLKWIEYIHGKK